MRTLTFEQLPDAVGQLYDKLQSIEQLLQERISPPPALEEQMIVSEAASFLRMSVSTLYGKVCRSEIPVSKRGKRLYFYRSELEAWIKAGRKKTKDEIRQELDCLPVPRRLRK